MGHDDALGRSQYLVEEAVLGRAHAPAGYLVLREDRLFDIAEVIPRIREDLHLVTLRNAFHIQHADHLYYLNRENAPKEIFKDFAIAAGINDGTGVRIITIFCTAFIYDWEVSRYMAVSKEGKQDTAKRQDSAKEQEERAIAELHQENHLLRETVGQLRSEIERYRTPALLIAELSELVSRDGKQMAIIRVPNGNKFLVDVSSDAKGITAGTSVLVEQKNLTVLEPIREASHGSVDQFVIIDKPKIGWENIGGLKKEIQEIQEVVELPLKKPELFKKVGITPPKGILLYGPPGTGKTLLAKAVAASTDSTFIEVVGSELVQKFIGEGAKLVKEIFELAREHAPAIVFIDEIDALAAKRIDLGTSGEREVQRTFMQLLAEIDGFNNLGNVKIIGATNRRDILDPAILRPGRLDRLIEVNVPDKDGLREIYKIHSSKMTIDKKTNLDRLLTLMKGFSGAEVRAVCTEAGYFAIRDNRTAVKESDLFAAVDKVKRYEEEDHIEDLGMYG